MALSRSVFTVLLLSVVSNASNVPVFLWGDLAAPNLKANPLVSTTAPAFSIILSNEIPEDTFTVVFVEETLSIEDFSRRNPDGQTSYKYLHSNVRRSVYLPSVENAVTAFDVIEGKKSTVRLTDYGVDEEIIGDGKFLIINLEDAKEDESRADLLSRHDDFMRETIEKLKNKYTNVVAVYTATKPSWALSRSRRQAEQAAAASTSDYLLDGLRLYVKNIKLSIDGAKEIVLQGSPTATSEIAADQSTMNTTLTFQDQTIVLGFRSSGGYWFFESVTLPNSQGEVLRSTEELYSLNGWSYRCANNITFSYGNGSSSSHVFFENMKIQPFFENYNTTTLVPAFGDSFNCVGFFSAPIWAGIFVVFILLSIMFYGIMMMMDIRTMDRFDDPKGKTITINTSE